MQWKEDYSQINKYFSILQGRFFWKIEGYTSKKRNIVFCGTLQWMSFVQIVIPWNMTATCNKCLSKVVNLYKVENNLFLDVLSIFHSYLLNFSKHIEYFSEICKNMLYIVYLYNNMYMYSKHLGFGFLFHTYMYVHTHTNIWVISQHLDKMSMKTFGAR